ncbi:phospholipase D family protein [Variovorax sp. J22R133]|uniref:phospholipase D family protein n=1 Tax=Variovorax brevis TaxID=3053503 RepID=UPI0025769F8C|nr:phospholipase D family protein [Variovorax sp. J22R133]MDM0111101.1 phospholipase D family protein [Variovorax sp. J22R133]
MNRWTDLQRTLMGLQAAIDAFAHCVSQAFVTLVGFALLTAVLGLVGGCASLPDSVHRTVSHAHADVGDTRLAKVAAASMQPDSHLSGVRLLPAGDQAFEARIALARGAQKALDVQYYQIANDASGRQFLGELRNAGARGVRVRVLVDDWNAGGEDELLAGLAAHPNIDVRMFNPLAARDGTVGMRAFLSLHEFSRVNRRMHNKLFVADNAFALSGGRNIANEYFDRSEPVNFIDMDLLSAGPVVRELSAVFDEYWNSRHAYPIQSLATGNESPEEARRRFDEAVESDTQATRPVAALDALGQGAVGSQLDDGRVSLHMAQVKVLADEPRKADVDNASFADGAVAAGNLAFLASARFDVFVASPYFVPGRGTLDVLRRAGHNKVQVSVMTNSLATTDEPLVHAGYARYRSELLESGVALYELMPQDADGEREHDGPYGSLGRLHAKLAVVDQRWLSIGSMNMDRRSAHSNTEMALIIDSPALAGHVSTLLRAEQESLSYRVRSREGEAGALQWVSRDGEKEVVLDSEPALKWRLQLRLSLVSMFLSEELL